MSVTINARGTSVPYFKLGKTGSTLYQGSSDPSLSYTITNGDVWFDTSANSVKFRSSGSWTAPAGSGTVTSVSVVTANGVSGSVANSTTTPAITLTLGAITPTSVAASGTVTGSNLSGTNSGDQTITLTGDVTGSGTGSFATTLATVNSSPQTDQFRKVTVNGKGLVTATSSVGPTDITTALGYTPYNSTNPNGYTSNTGTVTSVTVSGSNGIGVSGSPITTSGTISLSLGAITPTSVAASGALSGSNFSGSSSGTNTGDQTITLTGDVTGSGTGSFAATLATVNASPQTDTFRKVTVNGKGLVTATSAVSSSDITTALGYTPVNKAGDTMTGALVLNADPTTNLQAATKQYVDVQVVAASSGPSIVVVSTTSQAAVSQVQYVLTNTTAKTTVTLPASPTVGDVVWVTNVTGRTDCVIANNGKLLMGLLQNMTIDALNVTVQLRFISNTIGWRII